MSKIVDVFLPLDGDTQSLSRLAARALHLPSEKVHSTRVLRRSLDARKGHPLGHRLRLEAFLDGESPSHSIDAPAINVWPSSVPRPRVVIVGAGPAGTWAALRLAEAGVPATILERGKPVAARRHDIASVQRGQLDQDSNYCFGEGGAGTFSDGKLYTRAKDRAAVDQVLSDLVRFGGSPDIAIEARPHVGSNRLPGVLSALRAFLESQGVVYRFSSSFAGILTRQQRVWAVRTSTGDEIPADVVVLACGHSARDVYRWASDAGIALVRKGSAVGVRMEHPQPTIDRMQYGRAAGHPRLPPAYYELRASAGGRGVYSFCMCPGGFIVPAATEPDGVVVNGMSLSRRNSPYANAALVVSVEPDDYGSAGDGPLAGIAFQQQIERVAFAAGGGGFRAPAQRLVDFLAARPSSVLPKTSYHPGLVPARLDDILPAFVVTALRSGLQTMTSALRPLLHDDAVLVATETRTSAPVRMVRDPATLQSPSLAGLYPAGEGAGYAGGIVSSAIDGMRVATAILARG